MMMTWYLLLDRRSVSLQLDGFQIQRESPSPNIMLRYSQMLHKFMGKVTHLWISLMLMSMPKNGKITYTIHLCQGMNGKSPHFYFDRLSVCQPSTSFLNLNL